MLLYLEHQAKHYRIDPTPVDISIPLRFNGPQPNTYGVPGASAKAFEDGGFVGDVRRGGSCNFESYTFIPHCNGTHTECVGHITESRIAVHEMLKDSLIPATLISLNPVSETTDQYDPPLQRGDLVIDQKSLETALDGVDATFLHALIIRSLPNDPQKQERDYMQNPPPFFTLEAMRLIREIGVQHLLIDMPSVDRLFDEGKLSAHHIFWDVPKGSHSVSADTDSSRTITEMIYAPDSVEDGTYLLNLQIAPFIADAAPSRPQLFRIQHHE